VPGGSYFQISSFEGWLANSFSPIFGGSYFRKTPPPPSFGSPKNTGGVYFMRSGEICLRNFLPYPPQIFQD